MQLTKICVRYDDLYGLEYLNKNDFSNTAFSSLRSYRTTNAMVYTQYSFIANRKLFNSSSHWKFFKFDFRSWSIVFFGSDNYSLFSLKELHKLMEKKIINSLEVVVKHERVVIYNYAVSNNIKTHIWPPTLNGSYDFGVVVSFGKFIPQSLINQFPLGVINLHGSLLPKYRGGMPIVHALKNGETLTGVTVSVIKPDKFDSGDIILQKSCKIGDNELMPSLYNRLMHLGWECLLEVITSMPECLQTSFEQSEKDASNAPKLKKEVTILNWKDMTALEVFNLHRALFGMWELQSTWQGQPVKFVCISMSNSDLHWWSGDKKPEPGSFTYDKKSKQLYVQCKDKPVTVCSIRFKKKMYNVSCFHKGYLHKLSRTFWKFGS